MIEKDCGRSGGQHAAATEDKEAKSRACLVVAVVVSSSSCEDGRGAEMKGEAGPRSEVWTGRKLPRNKCSVSGLGCFSDH